MLQGDYPEWLLSLMYGLELPKNPVQAGYDATDRVGRKYQIKSRVVKDLKSPTSFDLSDIDGDFNRLLCVFFSDNFERLGVFHVSKEVARELGSQVSKRFCFRWNRQTSQDCRLKKIFWRKEKPGKDFG
jgi:hypothetical protein